MRQNHNRTDGVHDNQKASVSKKKTDTACDPGLDKIKQYQIQYIKIENGQIKHDWNALFIFLRLFFILAVSDLTSPFFFRKPFEYMMAIHLFLFPPRHKNTTNSINTMNKAKHFMEQDFPKEVDMHWGGNEAISIKFESKQEFTTYAVHLEKLERQF